MLKVNASHPIDEVNRLLGNEQKVMSDVKLRLYCAGGGSR